MLFEPYVCFHIFYKFGAFLGNSCCSLSLRYVFLVKVPNCHFSCFPPRFMEWEFLSDCVFS